MEQGRVLVVGPPESGDLVFRLVHAIHQRGFDAHEVGVPLDTSRALLDRALAEAIGGGWVRAVVLAPVDAEMLGCAPLGPEDGWEARCEQLLRLGLHVAQAAHRLLRSSGGQLVLVVPDLGISGSPERVPLTTALEGLRALVKSAARQWGDEAIHTATVLTASHLFDDRLFETLPNSSFDGPDFEQVADVVVGVLGPAGAALTGVTLPVDGGSLMLP